MTVLYGLTKGWQKLPEQFWILFAKRNLIFNNHDYLIQLSALRSFVDLYYTTGIILP